MRFRAVPVNAYITHYIIVPRIVIIRINELLQVHDRHVSACLERAPKDTSRDQPGEKCINRLFLIFIVCFFIVSLSN